MAERIRALIAIGFRVLGAAAADRVENDENGAGHAPLSYGRGVGGEGLPDDRGRLPSATFSRGRRERAAIIVQPHWLTTRVECRLVGEGGGEQRARVVVLRRAEDRPRFAALHHLAAPHHDDFARQRPHDPQIMRNEQIGEVATALQVAQQIDDLRLDRHVQGRRRLVEHHEARIERHRARNGDALALAAGELVRIAIERRWIEPGVGERAFHDAAPLGGVHLRPLRDQPLLDDLGHRHAWAKRTIRVLENDLHLAPKWPHGL